MRAVGESKDLNNTTEKGKKGEEGKKRKTTQECLGDKRS